MSNNSNFGSSSANISLLQIIQLPNEALETLENDDAKLPQTSALVSKIQNQQIFDINPEQSIPNIQEIIDSDEETTDDDTYVIPKPFASQLSVRLYVSRLQTMPECLDKILESSEDKSTDENTNENEFANEDMDENDSSSHFAEIFEDYSTPNFDSHDIAKGEITINDDYT